MNKIIFCFYCPYPECDSCLRNSIDNNIDDNEIYWVDPPYYDILLEKEKGGFCSRYTKGNKNG